MVPAEGTLDQVDGVLFSGFGSTEKELYGGEQLTTNDEWS